MTQTLVKTLSVIIPVYKSADGLPELVKALAATLPTLIEQYELIFVVDGSPDHSWRVVTELAHEYAWIRGIHMMRNYGQHNAVLAGIRAARYDLIATMDDDLQHPPDQLAILLAKLTDDTDVIYGAPQQEQHGLWRDLASQITKWALQSSMSVQVARDVSAFRVFRTQLRQAFDHYRSPYVNLDVLLTWATTRFDSVRVRHDSRKYGASTYTFRKLVTHAINMITGFSVLPLQIASLTGFIFVGFGGLILLYVIGRALVFGSVVPGFAFLASTIAIFAGAQLFALGIIGEYLARIHFRTMDRPVYSIRETTPDHPDDST